ncbi:MAG: choice-of-anchor U domain-containing protein [Burkholderiaceae bacterium]
MSSTLVELTRAQAAGRLKSGRAADLPADVREFARHNVDADNRIFVVIKADVAPELLAFVRARGGQELLDYPRFRTITARVPVDALGAIAQRPDVQAVGPREQATTNRHEPTSLLRGAAPSALKASTGSVIWEGVTAHRADVAHAAGHIGSGATVCVLSDGVDSLADSQATGELPSDVVVMPGQAGAGDEGTAMLEIVHDMAPGAKLVFATGFGGVAAMASSIAALAAAPYDCSIIVDDVSYFNEGAFQYGPIAQVVDEVMAAGVLYFSSSANSGNLTHQSSGTYEGDSVASSLPLPPAIAGASPTAGTTLHDFGGKNFVVLTQATRTISLKWSDPLGASGNDYDLIVTDETGTQILAASTSTQDGTQDPVEIVQRNAPNPPFPAGARIYVTAAPGSQARALRIDTHRGRLDPAVATAGSTHGHNATGLSVGAVNVGLAAGAAFVGGAANPVEDFSSDGPRQLFFGVDGAPITPGNFLVGTGGGRRLDKVDMAAADCGSTTVPGFEEFCGTSAAAPTAAAIAALIQSANPGAKPTQILAAMRGAALDIEAPGRDRDAGDGLLMVPQPLEFPTTISGDTGLGTASASLSGGGAACRFTSGGFGPAPAAAPAGVSFPHGFMQFTAAHCPAAEGAVTVTVTYPRAIPAGAQYYKYGKEPGHAVDHYYTIPATINGNQVSFTLTDGQRGDDDLTADGIIRDPGGIGVRTADALQPIPTLSELALLALTALLGLLAVRGRAVGRRRR